MDIQQYKTNLDYLFRARVTPLVWGRHGIGKSTAPEQYARDNGHFLFNLRLGNMEVGDLLGLPSTEGGVTRFNPPDWLKEVIDYATKHPNKYSIIHLDEINRVRKDMLSPVFQIALDNRLHTYAFPDNVRVIASANPPTKDYQGVYDIQDMAFLDRFCHLKLTPTNDEWITYMKAKGAHDDFTLFYSTHPTALEYIGDDFNIDDLVKPSRRSTEAAERLYSINAPTDLIYGCIGGSTGQMFYAWLQKNKAKAIRGEQVRTDLKSVEKEIKKLVKNGEVAALKTICVELTDYYKTVKETKDITAGEIENLRDFYDAIPEDLAYGQILLVLRGSEALMLSDFGGNKKYCEKWKKKVLAKPGLKELAKDLEPKAAADEEKTA